MKKLLTIALAAILFTSCGKDETTVTVDSSQPSGAFTATRSGTLTAQNSTPTKGAISIGRDAQNTNFLSLGSDFTTELGTGTATVYLSTSATFTASPGTGNPNLILVGTVQGNGARFYRLNAAPAATFTHVIIWCATANIPFGNGRLN